ncbi:L-aspartate oxidase [Microbacterium esteraromaticum]|uniref:L-aspartate oxidase n=1 Tax=Microbacterium esteraromaticum TaxID=57043 RepID=UPI00195672F3|nr:L-aspartate oxidase [Microbacterium esteraromaticum]MBM7467017.1 L-aspartate oxidase [Microbacterium esteraromaticum]
MNVIVAGGGIAGLTTALRADALGHDVTLVSKGALGDGCTAHAQGGIAGVYGPGDSPALHALDTLQAGDGHGDSLAITALVDGAPAAIDALIASGVPFDRTPDGEVARALEAAHSRPRIAHAGGDATGAAISAALTHRVRTSPITVREGLFVADLIVDEGRVAGIRSIDGETLRADAVVLATGGAGGLYAHTTNPRGTTADGIAVALRAGAAVADLEFMQFHPTVLVDGGSFLVSEAVRGAGAVLRDAAGRRFLLDEHPDAELAPRDVVARAIARRAEEQGEPIVLDATALGATALAERFPTIDAELRRRGIDWSRQPVAVTPAAHYLMGGVVTDVDGRTTLPGLWAVGETARTGVHGANRLASNSLLEGAVFGARAAESLALPAPPARWPGSGPRHVHGREPDRAGTASGFSRRALQELMWEQVGLIRTEEGLRDALARLHAWRIPVAASPADQEDANLLTVARSMASAALARTDSLGAHFILSRALIGAA